MGRGKKISVFVLMLVALTLLFLVAFPSFWRDCVHSVATGRQIIQYTHASAGTDGTVYAVGIKNDDWILTQGELGGGRKSIRTLESLGITDVFRVDEIFACSNGGVVMSIYEEKAEMMLRLYYVAPGERKAHMVYSASCETNGMVEIDGLTERGGVASFLLRKDGGGAAYSYVLGGESAGQFAYITPIQADASLFVLPDGQLASVSGNRFAIDTNGLNLPTQMRCEQAWRLTDGACLIDSTDGTLWRADMVTGKWMELACLTDLADQNIISWNVSPDGAAVFLTEEGVLLYLWDGSFQDYSSALYRPSWMSLLLLILVEVVLIVISLGVWYFLCEYRRFSLTIVARKGFMLAVILTILTGSEIRLVVNPWFEIIAEHEAQHYLQLAVLDVSILPDATAMDFELTDGEFYWTEGGFRSSAAALGLGSSWRECAREALDEGESFLSHTLDGVGYYSYFLRSGDTTVRVLQMANAGYLDEMFAGNVIIAFVLWVIALLVLFTVLGVMNGIRSRLRRVTDGMDAIRSGNYHVEVVDRTRDELGALADSVNDLAELMQENQEENARRGDVYAKFLPAQIAQLLGVNSVEDINKQSFSSRRMTIMHVNFTFDERVYETRSKALFDNINEITEATARIISNKGGTILSFSHEGFDAFFPIGDDAIRTAADGTITRTWDDAPISAAVVICQEATSINTARLQRHISPVRLHIALDEAEVMLGVVGDETRMQATAVSSSFSTIRILAGLFSRFEASILCTEKIEKRASQYSRRYIGKAHDGSELMRVYEIFDGDAQSVRQSKIEMERAFADGLYTLYAGDYTAAKRTFMEISHRNSSDGAARFYLYLADRFEKEPPEEPSLDG